MTSRLLRALDQWNKAHPWSHNDLYGAVVLHRARRAQRQGGRTALDIGCGSGNLLVRLAGIFERVVGIDSDPASVAQAKLQIAHRGNARAEAMRFQDLHEGPFDFVTMVATLHHMPLVETLRAAAETVAPGGSLVIVGISREGRPDRWLSLASTALNPIVGLLLHPRHTAEYPDHMLAPTVVARETTAQIAEVMSAELPGSRLRRGLFWRYVATWTRPGTPTWAPSPRDRTTIG